MLWDSFILCCYGDWKTRWIIRLDKECLSSRQIFALKTVSSIKNGLGKTNCFVKIILTTFNSFLYETDYNPLNRSRSHRRATHYWKPYKVNGNQKQIRQMDYLVIIIRKYWLPFLFCFTKISLNGLKIWHMNRW